MFGTITIRYLTLKDVVLKLAFKIQWKTFLSCVNTTGTRWNMLFRVVVRQTNVRKPSCLIS